MTGKRSRTNLGASIGFYLVRIAEWDWSYDLGVVSERFAERHYDEHRHLRIRGPLLRPRAVEAKTAELIFVPNIEPAALEPMDEPPALDDRPPPQGVGSLHCHGKSLIGQLAMTKAALGPVMLMLHAGRLKYVSLDGGALRYDKCFIRHYEIKEHDGELKTASDLRHEIHGGKSRRARK